MIKNIYALFFAIMEEQRETIFRPTLLYSIGTIRPEVPPAA